MQCEYVLTQSLYRPPGRDSTDAVEKSDTATGTKLYLAPHRQAVLNELGYTQDKCWPYQTLAATAVTILKHT